MAPTLDELKRVIDEMRVLADAAAPRPADVDRLLEIDAWLCELIDASALRCRELADGLSLYEEHVIEPLPGPTHGSTEAGALVRTADAVQDTGRASA